MDLSVVIAVHNEVDSVRRVIEEVDQVLPESLDFEIIVVDDGSNDDTPSVLQECRARLPRLRVLRHAQRSGQSATIGSGVRAARAHWVVTLDGDGQNDPADIMRLFERMDKSQDRVMLVIGQRVYRRDAGPKRISSRIANAVRAWVLKDNTPDSGCGIKLFARQTYLDLPQFDHMHRFLPALVQRQGGETLSVVVNHRERSGGASKYGIMDRLWVGIVDMLGVRWLQRRAMAPAISEIE